MKRFLLTVAFSFLMLFGSISGAGLVYAAEEINPFDETCKNFIDSSGNYVDNTPSVCRDNEANKAACAGKTNKECASILNPFSGESGILLRVARLIAFATGVASILIIIYGGLKYITSDGDSSTINSAKSTILYALIGVIVSISSQAIIVFVLNTLN